MLARAGAVPPRAVLDREALGCVLAEDVAADTDSAPVRQGGRRRLRRAIGRPGGTEPLAAVGELIIAGKMPSRDSGGPRGGRDHDRRPDSAGLRRGRDARADADRIDEVVVFEEATIRPGQNVLRASAEMRAGEVVVAAGSILCPAAPGGAGVGRAGQGAGRAPARCRDRADRRRAGRARPEARARARSATRTRSCCWPWRSRTACRPRCCRSRPTSRAELREILGAGSTADVLIVTGGVSAGQRDLVPGDPRGPGHCRVFHKVRLKPGKPLWFGVGPPRGDRPGALVFGLPGNPVSGLVGFLLFVRPALALWPASRSRHPLPRRPGWRAAFRSAAIAPPIIPSRLADSSGDSLAGCRRSRPWTGPARPTCARWPGPTVSPSFRPATAITRQEKLSASCRCVKMSRGRTSRSRCLADSPALGTETRRFRRVRTCIAAAIASGRRARDGLARCLSRDAR